VAPAHPIRLYNEVVEETNFFKYLGQGLTDNDNEETDFESKLAKAKAAFYSLNRQILKPQRLSIRNKMRMLTAVTKGVLFHSPTWYLDSHMQRQLQSFHMGCLRTVTGMYPKVVTEEDGITKSIRHPPNVEVRSRAGDNTDIVDQYNWAQTTLFRRLIGDSAAPEVANSFYIKLGPREGRPKTLLEKMETATPGWRGPRPDLEAPGDGL